MTTESFVEECHSSIERGHELWKSYFSKWESLAKYEEEVSESEPLVPPILGTKPQKKQNQPTQSKLLRYKKNKKATRKTVVKEKIIPAESKNERKIIKQCNNEELLDDGKNKQLEAILKSVFTEILNSNRNKFEIFAVLSQTSSQGDSSLFSCHLASANDFQHGNGPWLTRSAASGTPVPAAPFALSRAKLFNYARSAFNLGRQESSPSAGDAEQTARSPAFCSPNPSLKPPVWDFGHKSPSRVCRKINREYFIKRSFPEMNIAQDGKRFRSLCLRKRTNSVSLSMENSNFITPERKPSERKCFSENVSQRKRRRPSKVFFDNEVEEDSESDDQTEARRPLIHSASKKCKSPVVREAILSDSDDCDTIFDRVKAP